MRQCSCLPHLFSHIYHCIKKYRIVDHDIVYNTFKNCRARNRAVLPYPLATKYDSLWELEGKVVTLVSFGVLQYSTCILLVIKIRHSESMGFVNEFDLLDTNRALCHASVLNHSKCLSCSVVETSGL